MPENIYRPHRASRESDITIRGLRYHLRLWGEESGATVVLLHGIRDASATFQFLVDCFGRAARYIAPDWRDHGDSESTGSQAWFHDYLADLEHLLEQVAPNEPVDLVGHSLGGNVASVYAGLRPQRVRRLILLDAFGTLPIAENAWPPLLARWLRGVSSKPSMVIYESLEALAGKLRKANRRLALDKAWFLAEHLGRRLPDGRYTWRCNVVGNRSMPTLRHIEEWFACWHGMVCPALWLAAADPRAGAVRAEPETFARVVRELGPQSVHVIPHTGHNMHHDAPAEIARLIDDFLDGPADPFDGDLK